jgi:hypothetical protein
MLRMVFRLALQNILDMQMAVSDGHTGTQYMQFAHERILWKRFSDNLYQLSFSPVAGGENFFVFFAFFVVK